MRDFLRVLRVAKRHGAWLLLALISMVAVAGTTVFAFNLVRPMYDQVLRPRPVEAHPVVSSAPGLVGVLDSLALRAQMRLQRVVGDSRAAVIVLAMLASAMGRTGRYSSQRYQVRYSPYAFSYHNSGLIPGGGSYCHVREVAKARKPAMISSISRITRSGSAAGRSILFNTGRTSSPCSMAV